jgi:hypothetical protein
MDFILHGYCGLYCGTCPNMLNTRVGKEPNNVMLAKVSSLPDIARSATPRPAHAAKALNFVMSVPNIVPASECRSF